MLGSAGGVILLATFGAVLTWCHSMPFPICHERVLCKIVLNPFCRFDILPWQTFWSIMREFWSEVLRTQNSELRLRSILLVCRSRSLCCCACFHYVMVVGQLIWHLEFKCIGAPTFLVQCGLCFCSRRLADACSFCWLELQGAMVVKEMARFRAPWPLILLVLLLGWTTNVSHSPLGFADFFAGEAGECFHA